MNRPSILLSGADRRHGAGAARKRHCVLFAFALVAAAGSLSTEHAVGQVSAATVAAADREVARRESLMEEADAFLREGDLLLSEGMVFEAVERYGSAFLRLKQGERAEPLRKVALSKYERAATQLAEDFIKKGQFREAEAMVDQILAPEVGSEYGPALTLKKRLAEQDFYNHALTKPHVEKVTKVEELLQAGQDLINMGAYDQASMRFAEVLAYDPYNTGARRGLERVDQLVAKHGDSAYDQTRATALRQVGAGWETKVPRVGLDEFAGGVGMVGGDPLATQRSKLQTIVFPEISFSGTPVVDALEFLTQRSRDLDTLESDPARKGVNFILNSGEAADIPMRKVNLKLQSTPLGVILDYVTKQAGLTFSVDEFAVTVYPPGQKSDTLVTRRFRVAPNFLSGAAMGDQGSDDPFATPSEETSELGKRLTAREYLESNGISFPPGSLAQFIPETSTLVVRNTPENVRFIDAVVAGGKAAVPRQVMVRVRIIDAEQNRLKELGFDWLLGPFAINTGDGTITGGTEGSTRSNTVNTFNFPIAGVTGVPIGANIVTSPLRGAANGLRSDSIEGVINNSILGNAIGSPATGPSLLTPAIFSLAGVLTEPQFQVTIRAIDQKKGIDVLTAPATVVRSGERAEIRVVREFIYPTEYDPPELPNVVATGSGGTFPVTPANPTAFETRDVGSLLEVEPIIGEDDLTVDLNLLPEVTRFLGFVNYGSPITAGNVVLTSNRIVMPVFKSVKETTSVTVYDGQTVVMGGLLTAENETIEDAIPIAGDVPVLGRLFRSKVSRNVSRAIILTVSVRILDPAGMPVNDLHSPSPAQAAVSP